MNGSTKPVYDRRMDRTQDEAKLEKRRRRANMRRLLWSWGNTLARIQRLEQERAAFRAMADDARMTLRSPSLSGMPGGGARTDLSDVVARVMDEERRYTEQAQRIAREIDDAMRLRNCIEDCIARLSPAQESVLTWRYIDRRSWTFIAYKLNYDERSVRRIEAGALDAISAMIEITPG